MSYLNDIYRNFDTNFGEETSTMISFTNSTDIGTIVFAGDQNSGKYSILSHLTDKFQISPNDIQGSNVEIKNVIFNFQLIDCTSNNLFINNFEKCKMVIIVIDLSQELPIQLLESVQNVKETLSPKPIIKIFLNEAEFVEENEEEKRFAIDNIIERIKLIINDADIKKISINDGSSIMEMSMCIQSLLPKKKQLNEDINQFINSLDYSHAYLVDLQSRLFLLGNDADLDLDTFLSCQGAIEMFIGMTTATDTKTLQPSASIELKNGKYLHIFWPTYDVLLIGISSKKTTIATAKNNVSVLFHSIRRTLK